MKEKIKNIIVGLLCFLLKLLGIALILTVGAQIASRYIPNVKLVWTEELSRLIFVWYALLSIAVAYIEDKHLSLDILYEKLGPKAQRFLDGLEVVLTLVVSLVITVKGFGLLGTVKIQTSPILQVPMSVFYAAIPVGFVFVSVFALLNCIEFLGTFVKKEDK